MKLSLASSIIVAKFLLAIMCQFTAASEIAGSNGNTKATPDQSDEVRGKLEIPLENLIKDHPNKHQLTVTLKELIKVRTDKPIIVLFCAKWDAVSQLNELFLFKPDIAAKLKAHGVVVYIADASLPESIGARELRSRAKLVPLNLLYIPTEKVWKELPRSIHKNNIQELLNQLENIPAGQE